MELSAWHTWFKRRGGRELRELVMATWDPIDVEGVPEALNEYDGYLGTIADALRRGAGAGEIAALLTRFATDDMGLRPNRERDQAAARSMIEWYQAAMTAVDPGDLPAR